MQNFNLISSPTSELTQRVQGVRQASKNLCISSDQQRHSALTSIAESLEHSSDEILKANLSDIEEARKNGLNDALLSRLKLDQKKLRGVIEGVRKVALLPDPIGKCDLHRDLEKDLVLKRLTVPLGVLGVIFEARPDAVVQISSLAIKSGNGAILKGGSEAINTNMEIVSSLKRGLGKTDIDPDSICLLTSRQESMSMLKLDGLIDLIIPRGSNELVRFIKENTTIPVLGHADGVCHLYVDAFANIDSAISIAIDSKTHYPAACNAIETLLIHNSIAEKYLKLLIPKFQQLGVTLRGDEKSRMLGIPDVASEIDWSTEYLDLILSVKIVSDLDEALDHIQRYGSRHTDAIVTENNEIADLFLRKVDSSGVYQNCSTRFADGFRYGFGAEVGISTQTMPPRGPVGLEGLVTYKYFLKGDAHLADDFSSGRKTFLHNDLLL